ncbi:hypothetical protein [Flavicella marina]|uniref:hypothetical protein n=1 Tax=Flavicella marina TaxID=1475951 RepID=UPI0012641A89|nr:hypothetical protein [Flavicella marina]
MKNLIASVLMLGTLSIFAQNDTTATTIEVPDNQNNTQNEQVEAPPKQTTAKDENDKKAAVPFLKKIYVGGTFGATFGNYTSITVAPTIGYRLKPSLYTGLKVYYTYSTQKIQGQKYDYHNYGFGTFLRWFAFSDLYVHIAPEIYSYEYLSLDNNANVTSTTEWVPYLWAGAGIRKRTSKRSWVSVHVLFDLLNDKNSPFEQWEPNVVIGAGTSFGR